MRVGNEFVGEYDFDVEEALIFGFINGGNPDPTQPELEIEENIPPSVPPGETFDVGILVIFQQQAYQDFDRSGNPEVVNLESSGAQQPQLSCCFSEVSSTQHRLSSCFGELSTVLQQSIFSSD